MKLLLQIKTLDQKTINVDIDDSKTVYDLKSEVIASANIKTQPDKQYLIYSGRIMEDDHLIEKYNIDERKCLVVLAKGKESANKQSTKPKEEIDTKPGPSNRKTHNKSVQTKQLEKKQRSKSTGATTSTSAPKHSTKKQSGTIGSANSPPIINDTIIKQIMKMGYAEADVRRALTFSFNNADRAIEYLVDGIPEISGLPQPPEPRPGATNRLGFLRNDIRFKQIRQVIRNRPDLTTTVLNKIGDSNPALLALIRENRDEFLRLINDHDDTDEDLETIPGISDNIVLTDDERSAVERLRALGFPGDMVIQAYLACDKNEEQTADFLCRHMEDN